MKRSILQMALGLAGGGAAGLLAALLLFFAITYVISQFVPESRKSTSFQTSPPAAR